MTLEDLTTTAKGDSFKRRNRELLVIDLDERALAGSMVAYSADVNRSLSDLVGQSADETYQLQFDGDEGFVVVQPFEEGA